MQTSEEIKEPRKFQHNCANCSKPYRLSIQVDLRTIHRAHCPHCGHTHYFDNRDGRLSPRDEQSSGQSGGQNPDNVGTSQPLQPTTIAAHSPTPTENGYMTTEEAYEARSRQLEENRQPDKSHQPSPAYNAGGGSSSSSSGGYNPSSGSSSYGSTSFGSSSYRSGSSVRGGETKSRGGARYKDSVLKKKPTRSRYRSGFFEKVKDTLTPDWNLPEGNWLMIGLVGALLFGIITPILIILSLNFPGLYLSEPTDYYLNRLQGVSSNRILDRNGKLIAELFSSRAGHSKTGHLKPDQVPESLKSKLIFIEDQNFYDHGGVHWPSIFRAFFINLSSGGYAQGGSTLTQQLARILLMDRTRSIFRKLKETSLAYHLENSFTKEQLLTFYINHVFLGHGAVGMETAARFYFSKEIADLNFVQELILVSLPSAPTGYSPLVNPDKLINKLDAVYERMHAEQFTDISSGAYHRMKTDVFRSLNKSPNDTIFGTRTNDAPYVAEYIRLRLKKIMGKEFQYGAGLSIETTIDMNLQKAAMDESRKHIKSLAARIRPVKMKNGKRLADYSTRKEIAEAYKNSGLGAFIYGMPAPINTRPKLQTASLGLNPRTGEVLFMQGGAEFKSINQLNRAIDMRRQTGSSIKPIIYSAAIESGKLTAASHIDDKPIYVRRRVSRAGQPAYWAPQNISGTYEGSISVRRALAHSKNTTVIRAAQQTGLNRISLQFRKFFFENKSTFDRRFRFDPTIAIGTIEMSPLEMAVAYGAFGNNGVINRPFMIRRIKDSDGKVIYDHKNKDEFNLKRAASKRVISGDAAHVIASLMRDSGKRGGVFRSGFRAQDFIGKTGTTDDYRDAWFVGIMPGIVAAVWVGYDDQSYSMYRATGSSAAGPLFGRILRHRRNYGYLKFSPQAVTVQVCVDSGLLPLEACPERAGELFVRKFTPARTCDVHSAAAQSKTPGGGEDPRDAGDSLRDSDFED